MFKRLKVFWNIYKYRFVPWIRMNISPKSMNVVENKVIDDKEVLTQLIKVFSMFNELSNVDPNEKLKQAVGFHIVKQQSSIPNAGTGVFVSNGRAKRGQIVGIYPGTVYLPTDFIFVQSIANKYIFCCKDGIYIDGKNSGISKWVFKSCSQRDKVGLYDSSDFTWLSENLQCPLNIGQFVNNKTNHKKANVQYQEYNFLKDFPIELRKYIPNVNINGLFSVNFLRTVVLVALRDIEHGEELLSDYFTIVND